MLYFDEYEVEKPNIKNVVEVLRVTDGGFNINLSHTLRLLARKNHTTTTNYYI